MENQNTRVKTSLGMWVAIYVLAGMIWYSSQNFMKSTADQLIVLVIAVSGAYCFYFFDKKVHPLKLAALKRSLMFIGIWLICAFAVGLFTTLF